VSVVLLGRLSVYDVFNSQLVCLFKRYLRIALFRHKVCPVYQGFD
jgi:hypothetical protein